MRAYLRYLRTRLASAGERLVGMSLPWFARRALSHDLHGVWVRGTLPELPPGGVVVAPNHHSWWDGYLAWLVAQRWGRPMSAVMGRPQFERYPFFAHRGVLPHDRPREALRRLARGDLLVIFPEGELRPAGAVGPAHPGAGFYARHAGVPLLPLGLRVVMRGAQHPEAFVLMGAPLAPDEATPERWRSAVNVLLDELERDLAAADPEAPPPGYDRWLAGTRSTDRRVAPLAWLWRRP